MFFGVDPRPYTTDWVSESNSKTKRKSDMELKCHKQTWNYFIAVQL